MVAVALVKRWVVRRGRLQPACPAPTHPRRGRQLALLLLLSGLSQGCRPPLQSVSVPVSNWPGYEYFHLAERKWLAAAEGLELRTVEFADPQAIVHAYLRGETPLAQLTTVEAVDICSRAPDRCPVVVLVLDESRGADQLVARADLSAIPQLKGQRVAVTQSTLGPFVLSRALERSNLSLQDVRISHMPLAAMPAALARGDVDAAALFPPYSEQAISQAGARRLFDSSEIPGEIFDILVVDPKAMAQLKPVLPGLLRAWEAAHALRRRRPAEVLPLLARRERLSPQAFQQAERGLLYFPLKQQRAMLRPDGALKRNLKAVQNVQIALDLVRPGSPLPRVSDTPLLEALR